MYFFFLSLSLCLCVCRSIYRWLAKLAIIKPRPGGSSMTVEPQNLRFLPPLMQLIPNSATIEGLEIGCMRQRFLPLLQTDRALSLSLSVYAVGHGACHHHMAQWWWWWWR
uniref:Putative secreted peptide n=1 Tax=Anopheles braziliensis TaxID=58242 RepID=A0A2M3ZNS5_9DIPT